MSHRSIRAANIIEQPDIEPQTTSPTQSHVLQQLAVYGYYWLVKDAWPVVRPGLVTVSVI